ncbi:MAG: cytochrome c oxidase subunit II [Thermoleophilaceae bacterium]
MSAVATADTRGEFSELLSLYVPVAIAVFVLVCAALAVPLVRDRARPGRTPSRRTRAPRLEFAYVVGLALIAAVLAWRTLDGVAEVDAVTERAIAAPGAGPAGLTVRAVAAKWNWRFEYPGGVVQQGTGPDDFAVLVVPSGGAVRFRLTTRDVVHAFWIPAARYKYDAIPGRANVFDMQFDEGIVYDSARCSEFCGQYHDQMRFVVDVRPPGEFRAWLRERQEGGS